eukprot:TRINITY_DN4554_c1_g2_i1.p1 TRINITY_DN4554_c1_g2~~TRINITY_DN4554_c1_g2_i1.p1  ORF type:complete len:863 (+),score=206.77 TRINITY_DN4554_c1_g2_i1:1688-4276(+)
MKMMLTDHLNRPEIPSDVITGEIAFPTNEPDDGDDENISSDDDDDDDVDDKKEKSHKSTTSSSEETSKQQHTVAPTTSVHTPLSKSTHVKTKEVEKTPSLKNSPRTEENTSKEDHSVGKEQHDENGVAATPSVKITESKRFKTALKELVSEDEDDGMTIHDKEAADVKSDEEAVGNNRNQTENEPEGDQIIIPKRPMRRVHEHRIHHIGANAPRNAQPHQRPPPHERTSGRDYDCLVSSTTLILPFHFTRTNTSQWITELLARTIVGPDGEDMKLWKVNENLPHEVFDLDPHFRNQMGCYVKWDGGKGSWNQKTPEELDEKTKADKIWRLELTRKARLLLFRKARLECEAVVTSENDSTGSNGQHRSVNGQHSVMSANNGRTVSPKISRRNRESLGNNSHFVYQNLTGSNNSQGGSSQSSEGGSSGSSNTNNNEPPICRIDIRRVTLVVFPYGTALLRFHINWLPQGHTLNLAELRTWLYLAKRLRTIRGVFKGWSFRSAYSADKVDQFHQHSLGQKMFAALYLKKHISLIALSKWLVRTDIDSDEKQIHNASRAYHHTTVVVDSEMKGELLNVYLFHLRHAHGQKNRPPPQRNRENFSTTYERVLQPRRNRYIAMSREGTVSLSWPTTKPAQHDYEIRYWPTQFQGIYCALATHVHGEKLILSQLSTFSATTGKTLRKIMQSNSKGSDINEVERVRQEILSYVMLVTQYTLQMSSDDCGGYTEYVQFFTAARNVFAINNQRQELNTELREVLQIVESNFNEEQRKLKKQEQHARQLAENRKARFEMIVGAGTSITLPVMVISSVFGMNNSDTPIDVSWYTLIIVSCIVSVTLFVAFFSMSRVMVSMNKMKSKRLEYLNKNK